MSGEIDRPRINADAADKKKWPQINTDDTQIRNKIAISLSPFSFLSV